MSKQGRGLYRFYTVGLFLLCHAFLAQANELNPHELLKKHYLSKFTEGKSQDRTDDSPAWQINGDDLQRYPLSERMTPLRSRAILLHYLCPECSGKRNRQNVMPVNFHTDVWLDTQVFKIPGKAHLYAAAFPGTTIMGEAYGAYMLVAGATQDIFLLRQRQSLVHQLQESGLLVQQARESLKKMEQLLTRGLAIFDRQHPFNTLAKADIFTEEVVLSDWLANSGFGAVMEAYLGTDKEADAKAIKQGLLHINLQGRHASGINSTPYFLASAAIVFGVANYWFSGGARKLTTQPWQGGRNCVSNVLSLLTRVGGYSQPLVVPLSVGVIIYVAYKQYWQFRNIKEVLIDELVAVKPFLEILFSFSAIQHLPLIDFTLSAREQHIIYNVWSKTSHLRGDDGHHYQGSFAEVASTLRWLLLLREMIVRYLVNIARLDFYISVAKQTSNSSLWVFAEYDVTNQGLVKAKPKLTARKLWNPVLSPKKAVASDVRLGGNHPANIVLTGVNASGKSTFLRGLGINTIFMAQTLGVAAAKSFKFRPYTHFDSLMEKRDKNGRSSYETEVDTVAQVWAVNSRLCNKHRSLVLVDELFRTTNPQEGASASKVLVRKLGELPHLSLLVSTHFTALRQLAVENPKRFANKHMSVEIDEGTSEVTKMNYRLADGPSPYINAIQLFDQAVMEKYPELYQD